MKYLSRILLSCVFFGAGCFQDGDQKDLERTASEYDGESLVDPSYFGKVYTFKSKLSGNILKVKSESTKDRVSLIEGADTGSNNQNFLLFPADNGSFLAAAKHSGKVIDVLFRYKGLLGGSNGISSDVVLMQNCYDGYDEQTFFLGPKGEFYTIRAGHNGELWSASGLIKLRDDDGEDDQKFILQHVDTLSIPQPQEHQEIGDIPRLEDESSMLPEFTEPVVVGSAYLPYFLVDENVLTESYLANNAPYYLLVREQYWRRVYHHGLGSLAITTYLHSFTSRGMEEEIAASMKTMVGFSLGADFGLDFHKKARLFKGYISKNLGVPVSSSSESICLWERTEEIKYDGTHGCGPVAITTYQLVDSYKLFRGDGSYVDSWRVISDREPQKDVYPLECGNSVEIKMIDEVCQ